jgi:hypothetical protein
LTLTGNISTTPALFGTNAPILGLDTTYNVKPVQQKWKHAKEVCINLKAGSVKIALFVNTMPIVAAMLIAVHIRNLLPAPAVGFGGAVGWTGESRGLSSSSRSPLFASTSRRGMLFSSLESGAI